MKQFKFDAIKYRNTQNGTLELYFDDSESNRILYFEGGGGFRLIENDQPPGYENARDYNGPAFNEIIGIRETGDYDYILQMNQDVFAKIFYLPNDEYGNGVQQVLMVYQSQDRHYKDIEQDFLENSKEVSF
jgi:hypothetical protein